METALFRAKMKKTKQNKEPVGLSCQTTVEAVLSGTVFYIEEVTWNNI